MTATRVPVLLANIYATGDAGLMPLAKSGAFKLGGLVVGVRKPRVCAPPRCVRLRLLQIARTSFPRNCVAVAYVFCFLDSNVLERVRTCPGS